MTGREDIRREGDPIRMTAGILHCGYTARGREEDRGGRPQIA